MTGRDGRPGGLTPGIAELAQVAPKVDLHCHLTGSVTITVLTELLARAGRPADTAALRDAYNLAAEPPATREEKFFRGLDLVAALLHTPDDLAFAVYALATAGARDGGLRYLELFVNPTALCRAGMTFRQMRDGLLDGARAALADNGVIVRFIACFLRDEPLGFAEQMLDELIEHRVDDFIGVGLDGPELLPDTEAARFAAVYRRAGAAGFRRTAHLTETGPEDLAVCLDELGCDRIDHGYPVVDDPAVLERARQSGVGFTCCLTITRDILGGVDPRFGSAPTHPTTAMLQAGLPIAFGTDDGALVGTDIGAEYATAARWYSWDAADLRKAAMRGLDLAWLDESDKRAMRAGFTGELDVLLSADATSTRTVLS